jgi:hypothetical protein
MKDTQNLASMPDHWQGTQDMGCWLETKGEVRPRLSGRDRTTDSGSCRRKWRCISRGKRRDVVR